MFLRQPDGSIFNSFLLTNEMLDLRFLFSFNFHFEIILQLQCVLKLAGLFINLRKVEMFIRFTVTVRIRKTQTLLSCL